MKYLISKYKYHELKYLCLQYKEMKSLAKQGNIREQIKCSLIEYIASESRKDISKYILEAVTTGKKWEQLEVPCGRRQFYEARRNFFWMLSQYI